MKQDLKHFACKGFILGFVSFALNHKVKHQKQNNAASASASSSSAGPAAPADSAELERGAGSTWTLKQLAIHNEQVSGGAEHQLHKAAIDYGNPQNYTKVKLVTDSLNNLTLHATSAAVALRSAKDAVVWETKMMKGGIHTHCQLTMCQIVHPKYYDGHGVEATWKAMEIPAYSPRVGLSDDYAVLIRDLCSGMAKHESAKNLPISHGWPRRFSVSVVLV